MLQQQGLLFVLDVIQTKFISQHHNDQLAKHFSINKTTKSYSQRYYWSSHTKYIKAFVKDCNVCLASKKARHKGYGKLQTFSVPTHQWKNFLIYFLTVLPVSTNQNGEIYDSILIIVKRFIKMLHYKLVKVTINTPGLAQVILDKVIWYHRLPNLMVTDRGLLFTSKF